MRERERARDGEKERKRESERAREGEKEKRDMLRIILVQSSWKHC